MEEKTALYLLVAVITILLLVLFSHLLFRIQKLEQKYDSLNQTYHYETCDYCERNSE